MTDVVETIRPLELLNRAAQFVGAVVCLTSSADQRSVLSQTKPFTRREGSKLRLLAVVKPAPTNRGWTRWEHLARGVTLCSVEMADAVPIDDAATVLAERLTEAINDWRKRSAA